MWIFYLGVNPILRVALLFLLCGVATGALVVSVISDGVLTALRLPETRLAAEFLIPIFSIAIMSNAVTISSFFVRCSGTNSCSGRGEITTPAA